MLAQQQAIENARRLAEAEAANRAKSQFLASLSHELRTPLNAIGGYIDLILNDVRGPVSQQVKDDLVRVRSSQQHLLALINDLLNFSRIEAGRLTYDTVAFDIAPVVGEAVGLLHPQAVATDIALECGDCPSLTVFADLKKVEQILLNLISNALKFTPSGGRVTLSCRTVGAEVEIDVADTGCGIPDDEQQAIFDPFVQVGRSLTSSHEGTGLGLSISRELARGMNGDLRVVSRVDHGSTFTLVLPTG
jgi:signal transduction histidine kinase